MENRSLWKNIGLELKELGQVIKTKPLGSMVKVGGTLALLAALISALAAYRNASIQQGNYLTAQAALANTQAAFNKTTEKTEAQHKLQETQIQLQLRERYLELKPSLDATRYEIYPVKERYLKNEHRRTLRRYWTDVVFSEWLAVKKFGNGALIEQWNSLYSKWALNVLCRHAGLREEWCYIQGEQSEKIYFGVHADAFVKEINGLYEKETGEPLDLKKEKANRWNGTPPEERVGEMSAVTVHDLDARLDELTANAAPDEKVYLAVLKDALDALKRGNYGVAACLVDKETGKIKNRAQNQVFIPVFRSDSHAEMLAINQWEAETGGQNANDGVVLYTSLEPCPMCLARIISSPIKEVRYLADDALGGMASKMVQMPPVWQQLAKDKVFVKANCRQEITILANDIFVRSRENLDKQLSGPKQ